MHRARSLLQAAVMGGVAAIAASAASAVDPEKAAEDSFITLRGTVVDTNPTSFDLDYGEGLITVETDDWDAYREGEAILDGDDVTVWGRIDDGFYERRTIEAERIYVEDLNTFFYDSSAADEEGDAPVRVTYVDVVPVEPDWLTVTGRVTEVDGREFTVDTAGTSLKVDTDEMLYNPMDDKGFQKITIGDRVSVSGPLDADLFEATEIKAKRIVSLDEKAP